MMLRSDERSAELVNFEATQALSLDKVQNLIAEAIQPAHFFVQEPLLFEWEHHPSEVSAWEIYQGRLLEPAHTLVRQSFESWNVFSVEAGSRSTEPILSLKLDADRRQVHVTRAIHCYAWEGYHAGNNVYLSRETRKWVRELVGSIPLDQFSGPGDLRAEIVRLLFQAVVGCSRLPLQSLEAPLPAFSLGWLAYFPLSAPEPETPQLGPMQSFRDLVERGLHDHLAWLEKAKLLEALLRSTPREQLGPAAESFLRRWRALNHGLDDLVALCRTLFNEVALSPYTDFVEKLLIFLRTLVSQGHLAVDGYADVLGYILRQNARHLTAYDLITFHHRGANYPDALLLDTVLRAYLALIDSQPELFATSPDDDAFCRKRKQMRRRALRQAWVLRRTYEGLPVPNAPTSPGENARVLPPPFERVPEEQIFQPGKRSKRLFEGEPLLSLSEYSQELLRQSLADLQHPEELQELGMAVFLDRPFGIGKGPAEPDRTMLLSYETFSRSVAERRLRLLAMDPAFDDNRVPLESCRAKLLADLPVNGIPITPSMREQKPGSVALHDASRVADDFLVLRMTSQAMQTFLEQFDFTPLGKQVERDYLDKRQRPLIVSASSTRAGPAGSLDVYDAYLQRRLELQIDLSQGYASRAGREYPAAGLRVLRVWEADGGKACERVVEQQGILLPPRD